jgi:hypothetical protein
MPRNGLALAFDGHGAIDEMANSLGPVAAIRDDDSGSPGNTLAEYAHLGIVWVVQEDFPERGSLPPAALCLGVRRLDAAFVFAPALAFQAVAVAGPKRKRAGTRRCISAWNIPRPEGNSKH